jgi:hypothetical protein
MNTASGPHPTQSLSKGQGRDSSELREYVRPSIRVSRAHTIVRDGVISGPEFNPQGAISKKH